MTTMLERVATAIEKAQAGGNLTPAILARTVIEAMKEPSEDMLDAPDCGAANRHDLIYWWRDMIEAALSEK